MATDLSISKREAQGRWPGILQSLGVDPQYLNGNHGPCPMCGGKDRFRFTDFNGGGGWFCNHCEPGKGDGFDLLVAYHGWTLRDAVEKVDEVSGTASYTVPKQHDEQKIKAALNRIRSGAVSVEKVPAVGKYLDSRGLVIPPALRAHAGLRYFEEGQQTGTYPAMLAKIAGPDGTPLGYHITHLTDDGTKAPVSNVRKLRKLRPDVKGWAIRLWPANELVAIAEGIETAIAVRMIYGVPAWSVLNTAGMKNFVPPAGIKAVIIAGDNDAAFAGQLAAYQTADRLARAGYRVVVRIPADEGDWNDELQRTTTEERAVA